MSRILRNVAPFFATLLALSGCGGDATDGGDPALPEATSMIPEGNWSVPEGASPSDGVYEQFTAYLGDLHPSDEAVVTGPGYYVLRHDLRRCAPTHCGGFFAKRVNGLTTVCADGNRTPECYVADLDWSVLRLGAAQASAITDAPESFLFAGDIVSAGGDATALLQVTEAWQGQGDEHGQPSYLRVKSTGTVCIDSPCPSLAAELLNSRQRPVSIGEVDLSPLADQSNALDLLKTSNGLLVAASPTIVTGPAGRALGLAASEVYVPVVPQPQN
jgi:hypothetical protein